MKKLFALFMVVAMLAVAGSAMATSITADRTDVSVNRGETATVTVTGTASHGGTLAYELVDALDASSYRASLSGTTVTLTAPSSLTESAVYTVIVRVTETYEDIDDTVGHVVIKTDTADVQITVNVIVPVTPKPEGGSSAANSKQQTIVLINTEEIKTKAPKFESANVTTPDEAKKPSVNDSTVTKKASEFSQRLGGGSSTSKLSDPNVFKFEDFDKSGQDLVNEQAGKMTMHLGSNAKGNERLGPIIPKYTPNESGLKTTDLNYGQSFEGASGHFAQLQGVVHIVGSDFSASATTEEVIFLDRNGNEVTTIPDDGFVTAVTYVEAGKTYEPIAYAEIPQDKLAAFDAATGTEEKTVNVETVVTVTETVNSTATFSPVVADGRVIDAVTARYGKEVKELPYTAASTTETWTTAAEEKTYMDTNNIQYVCSLPVLENVADGAYIAVVTFDNTPTGTAFEAPKFYPDGVKEGGAATSAKLYTVANGSATEVTGANAKSVIENGRAAYLVFEVAGGKVATAGVEAAAVKLSKPSITVKPASESGGELTLKASKSTVEVKVGETAEVTLTTSGLKGAATYTFVADEKAGVTYEPATGTGATALVKLKPTAAGTYTVKFTVTDSANGNTADATFTLKATTDSDVKGVGSSGGGCSAGSAVLAMAVLGAFIATRKK